MKANQSVENYDSRIREYANYSFRQSRNICKTIGKREAGSIEEKNLANHIKNELETCADEVNVEEFNFCKDFKILQNKVGAICFIFAAALVLATILFGITALCYAAIGVSVVGIILSLTGKAYAPKKLTSQNVYAIKKPSGEAKNRIVFVSNTDCVRVSKLTGTFLKIMSIISAVCVVCVSAYTLSFENTEIIKYLAIPVAVFTIFDVIILFSSYTGVLDGANKNLSGIFTSIAVLKYLKDMNISMEKTEIEIVVTGAHEASISGANEFVKKHKNDLENINTKIVCLDTLREDKNLRIESENVSSETVKEISDSAKENDIDLSVKSPSFLSDAKAFSKEGFDAVTLTAASENFEKEEDTYEDMKIKTIEMTLKTIMQEVFFSDEK